MNKEGFLVGSRQAPPPASRCGPPKAPEDWRTPKPGGFPGCLGHREASWTAVVLDRFALRASIQAVTAQTYSIEQAEVTLHRANGEIKKLLLSAVGYKRILKTGVPDVVQITIDVPDARSTSHLTVVAS